MAATTEPAAAASDAASQRLEAALAQIQPLRDLVRNWDVDIASCLQDYLEEIVDHFATSQDGNNNQTLEGPPNFAQAAVLLQNSSSVYSRKVEYLYELVYATLDELVASSSGCQHAAKERRSARTADADIDVFHAFDPELEFLLLDDVLPMDETTDGNKINLSEDAAFPQADVLGGDMAADLSHHPAPHHSSRLSLGGLSVTRLDRSALAPNSAAARALMGSLFQEGADTGGGSLRLLDGRCDVGADGALLLPGTAMMGGHHYKPTTVVGAVPDAAEFDSHHVDFDDGEDAGGFAMMDQDDDPGVDTNAVAGLPPPDTTTPAPDTQPDKPDPWALLDPHDSGISKARPLRIGVTYSLPDGVDEPPSKSVTGARTRRSKPKSAAIERPKTATTVCIATETFKAAMANEKRKRQATTTTVNVDHSDDDTSLLSVAPENGISTIEIVRPHVPLRGLAFGDEFAYIAKKTAKRKAMERRERRKLLTQDPQAVDVEEADQLLGFADVGGGWDNDDDDSVHFDNNGDEPANGPLMGNTGMASLDDAFPALDNDDDRDTSNVDAIAFEALCRAHVKAFSRGAEKYATETNLTKRVGEWQDRLVPILEEEETRPEFDIHCYSDRVIGVIQEHVQATKRIKSVDKPSKSVAFQSVTRTCENYEVCRLFLAALTLSNSGNVAFSEGEGIVSTPESLRLQLLRADVDRPMDTYLAPSAQAEVVP